jgi:8-oxo-dGTP pyrophosphatase MutT (NUDIX family)
MKKLWQAIGTTLFWLTWPFTRIGLRMAGERARVLVVCGNQILLVKSWLSAGQYELPGGGRHPREQLTATAVRELKEETGLVVAESDLQKLFASEYREHGLRVPYVCFAILLDQMPDVAARASGGITAFRWAVPADIDPLQVSSNVPAAVKAFEGAHGQFTSIRAPARPSSAA